jgi:hypothetical protein
LIEEKVKGKINFPFFFFIVGTLLLTINVYGQLTSLRNPEIFTEQKVFFKNDIVLTEDQVYAITNTAIGDRKVYVKNVNVAVNQGVAHYWNGEGLQKYHLQVPIYENYVLFVLSYIVPQNFRKYEFLDYRRALERGVGLCSQHAIILAGILNEKGITSKIIGLSGHVVLTAQVDEESNEWWVLDPDYGVVIPYDLDTIEKEPEIIKSFYAREGYDDATINLLIGIYNKDGNILVGVGEYSLMYRYFETASYILIWVLPLILILPYFYPQFFKGGGKRAVGI